LLFPDSFIIFAEMKTKPTDMKRILGIALFVMMPFVVSAQQVEYQTFIYTSDKLADEIQEVGEEADKSRGLLGYALNLWMGKARSTVNGYITQSYDMGLDYLKQLTHLRSEMKKKWEETVKAENVYEEKIRTVSEVSDFYKNPSFDGAMDPKGMRFNGIGCLRKEDGDTVFYVSCHIDRSKIHRIINHSKFELVMDTLIVSPTRSNLPNTPLDIPYSFKERKNFNLNMHITLSSSWMNELVQLTKDEQLGEFVINVPVEEDMLDSKGFLRYVRNENDEPRYAVVGESFIVPRSYMGYRDEEDNFKNSWGTGEYKLDIVLKETCDVTDEYRKNWAADRKHRKQLKKQLKAQPATTWQTVSNQRWDEASQSWVVTTLKAPAGTITKKMLDKLNR